MTGLGNTTARSVTPGHIRTRQPTARGWFAAFVILTLLLALAAFLTTGNAFETMGTSKATATYGEPEMEFNTGLAFAAAAGVIIAWLPIIALFDYLRRGRD